MEKIEVHGGSFKATKHCYFDKHGFSLKPAKGIRLFGESIGFDQIESCEVATEESARSFLVTAGAGLAGGLLLGPLGLLAGALSFGKRTRVTFIVKLNDGRGFIATANAKSYAKFAGFCMA